jgi:cathepsin L
MNKSVALIALVALIAGAAFISNQNTSSSAFEEWKAKYGANWAAGEEEYRRVIFERNVAEILRHNADASQTYKKGINQFTALTQEEFINTYLTPMKLFDAETVPSTEEVETPSNVNIDWTQKNGVSPVKNQGQCGSCWAFSATGVLESNARIHGSQVSLSEQQLVDCSGSYGNHGCNGGWPASALNYVKDHGIASESEYPYRAVNQNCQRNGGNFHISSHSQAAGCNGLSNAINSKPISVTVDAGNWSSYHSGVFNNCGGSINHAVLLVGATDAYWKIKNSWGTGWGEQGFIRLSQGNTCGICTYPGVYPN